MVKRGKNREYFKIEHRSADYTSLIYDKSNDFIRIKMTDNTRWISLALTYDDQKAHMDDPLFDRQKEKSKRHWKSDFDDLSQLRQYLDLAYNACQTIPLGTVRDISSKEKEIADYLYDLFVNCGAEPSLIFYYTLAKEFELMYRCGGGSIRFKSYAKKPGGYINMDRDWEKTKLYNEKRRLPFVELSDLNSLQEELIPLKIKRGIEMEKNYNEHYTKYQR